MLKAEERFRLAAEDVQRCLAGTAKTRDGRLFGSQSEYYWRIVPVHMGLPRLQRLDIWPYYSSVEIGRNGVDVLLRERHVDGQRQVSYRISDLYSRDGDVKSAYIAACKETLKSLTQQVAEMEAAIGLTGIQQVS